MMQSIIETMDCGCSITIKEDGSASIQMCGDDSRIVHMCEDGVFDYPCGCEIDIQRGERTYHPCRTHLRLIREYQLNLPGVFAAIRRAQAAHAAGAEDIRIPGSKLARLPREDVLMHISKQ